MRVPSPFSQETRDWIVTIKLPAMGAVSPSRRWLPIEKVLENCWYPASTLLCSFLVMVMVATCILLIFYYQYFFLQKMYLLIGSCLQITQRYCKHIDKTQYWCFNFSISFNLVASPYCLCKLQTNF